jgi:hypothetical protein
VHITGNLEQIGVLLDKDRMVPSLVEVADASVPPVENPRVADVEVPHEFRQIRLRRLHHEMEMIAHQYITQEPNGVDVTRSRDTVEERHSVGIVPENVPPFIPPATNMIIRAFILYS